jgi:hypothetical protein
MTSGKGLMVDGSMEGTCTRGRGDMVRQDTRELHGSGTFFFNNPLS